MKKIILVLSLSLLSIVSFAQEIKWMTMDEALKAQEKEPKPIFYGCLHRLVWPL